MMRQIKTISKKVIEREKVYLYSAGFNVDKKLNGIERIEEEIEDLKLL